MKVIPSILSYCFSLGVPTSDGEVPSLPSGLAMHKVPLRNIPSSPWCYAATVDPTYQSENGVSYNFLATQVWPSAREASIFLENRIEKNWKVCELGCGPALPSMVIASLGIEQVIATDIDLVALQMVKAAAREQGLINLVTMRVDLTGNPDNELEGINADLYFMSDVFENTAVARGAAAFTKKILDAGCGVWAFSQSDRAQKDIYISELKHLDAAKYGDIEWQAIGDISDSSISKNELLLIELDELQVKYC